MYVRGCVCNVYVTGQIPTDVFVLYMSQGTDDMPTVVYVIK